MNASGLAGPVRVVMVAAMPYPTAQGTQALVGELARGLALRGHRVHLVCYHHSAFERDEPFAVHRIAALPGYDRLRSGPDPVKPLLDVLLATQAAQVARSEGCHLVHSHNYEGALAGWMAALLAGVPHVYHAHNLMGDELPTYFRAAPARLAARVLGFGLDRLVPRLADRVIALHRPMADALISRGVGRERVSVVAPGVDLDYWADGVDPDPVAGQVVYCGNLDTYQNLPLLFRAMARVQSQVPEARLLLATANDLGHARDLLDAHRAGAFTELCSTPDVEATRSAYRESAVAVSPRTSWSGFPVKTLNAAASGLPLVVCRGASFGVEHEETGLVVPDGDAEALAKAIVQLLRSPDRRSMLGRAGKRMIRKGYSLDRMLTGVEGVWADALGFEAKVRGSRDD